jgi:hypothetical protein
MSGARKKSKDHGANNGGHHPGLRRDTVDRECLDQKVGNHDPSLEQKILIRYFLWLLLIPVSNKNGASSTADPNVDLADRDLEFRAGSASGMTSLRVVIPLRPFGGA